jgi:hypothetical protein
MHIPLGKLKFQEGVEFGFPNHLCCNCGTKADLKVVAQDTRRTTYLIAGGTETTFRLPLPFCSRCAPSAKRRPKNVVHRILLFALALAIYFVTLIVLGEFFVKGDLLAKYLTHIAVVLAALTTLGVVLMARPKAGQSSYFQPVRIPTLKREFLSGAVTAIGFSFSNREYAQAFKQENRDAIARKQLLVGGA